MGRKITVLGAGNAGFTLAFHLSHLGNEVALFEHPNFKQALEGVQRTGEIVAVAQEGEFKAVLSGTAKIHLATCDIKEAIEFGEVVMIIVPAFGQVPIFELAMPYLKEGQIFVSLPGNFASLQYAKVLKEKGVTKKLYFVDTDSIPYACRKLRDNQCFISGMKQMLNTGVYPAEATDHVLGILQPMFMLKLERMNNVLEAAFCNINMIVHPPPTLLNVGWIEVTGGKFSFYRDGCSPSVCKIMDAIDAERVAIAKALNLKTITCLNIDKGWYGDSGFDNNYEHIHSQSTHAFFPAPASLNNRYIDEDMAYLLAPIAQLLGHRYGVKTPVIDALILLAEIMTGKKLEPKRGFDHVIKDGESIEQLHERLNKWMV